MLEVVVSDNLIFFLIIERLRCLYCLITCKGIFLPLRETRNKLLLYAVIFQFSYTKTYGTYSISWRLRSFVIRPETVALVRVHVGMRMYVYL